MVLTALRQRIAAQPRGRLALISVLFIALAVTLSRPLPRSAQTTSPGFAGDYTYSADQHVLAQAQERPKRVAIVGAGASGAAAAWFLRRAGRVVEQRLGMEEGTVLGDIVVFEREGYVGGRSTTVFPHGDERLRPFELGASIFVEANRHMIKAAKHFNLTLIDPDFGERGIGIWDGSSFLYTTSASKSRWAGWWDTLSALRRYGPLSPYRTDKAVGAMLAKFSNLYNPTWLAERGVMRSVEEFAEVAGLGQAMTARSGDAWAREDIGAGARWVDELMEGSTRCNYAADMDGIHALGTAASMAAVGASAIDGGNWRVFAAMLAEADAKLRLETEVSNIIPLDAKVPSFLIATNSSSAADEAQTFDQVFFAAPWHLSPISKDLQRHFNQTIHPQEYVHLHVTLFATTRPAPLPSFFGLPEGSTMPTTILTTRATARATPGAPDPEFQSMTWHGETAAGSGEYVVKIFSLAPVTDAWVESAIGEAPGWLLRKEWDSYPVLARTASFPPVEPIRGMQYLAALEPWISTMETQTLSAREGVARVAQDWWGLGLGECVGGDAWDWSCVQ